jgi:hypothetical protein
MAGTFAWSQQYGDVYHAKGTQLAPSMFVQVRRIAPGAWEAHIVTHRMRGDLPKCVFPTMREACIWCQDQLEAAGLYTPKRKWTQAEVVA